MNSVDEGDLFPLDMYKKDTYLGGGAYASVYRFLSKTEPKEDRIAVKKFRKPG